MSIEGFYLLPHPPIIIPEVGRGEERKIQKTNESMELIGREIGVIAPETIIIITPHGVMFSDAIAISYEEEIYGDLGNFGVPSVSMKFSINKTLVDKIDELAKKERISVLKPVNSVLKKYDRSVLLDHGSIVPLYFINKHYKTYKIVHITYAALSDTELYKFGMCVKQAVEELNEKAVIIASGDLSHKLKDDGPYAYDPAGEVFDEQFMNGLKKGDIKEIFQISNEIIYSAGECGRRSVAILLGTLERKKFKGQLLSYEGPFGVGYGVMRFEVVGEDESKLNDIYKNSASQADDMSEKDPYVSLAKESLLTYIKTGKEMTELPDYITEEMQRDKRGVFVSLKKYGALRGCIGTVFPATNNVAEEIIRNAIEAGINDPRFREVQYEEIEDIVFSVDVLTEPERASKEELNPKIYGVIVRCDGRAGVLLPNLEGIDTVQKQLGIVLDKAGIFEDEKYTIEKFKVIRHK